MEENSGVQVSMENEEIDAYIKLVIKEKEKILSGDKVYRYRYGCDSDG
jgi:hypothetical protein